MAGLALILTLAVLADPKSTAASPPQVVVVPQTAPVVLEEVEVLARRGAALVEPETELDGPVIDLLGADDIGGVIRRLTEDHALGDAPVIIVNGRRMADPGVFSGFPPDALVRVEVLPPQAGALYGADDPSRRVVNIVLQRRFQSRDGRLDLRRPTAGGMTNAALDLRRSAIEGARTRQVGVQIDVDTALRSGDRDRDTGGDTGGGAADDATLRPAGEGLALNLTETASLGDWAGSLRAGARAQESRSVFLSGGEPVGRRRRTQGVTATGGLNGELAGWSTQLSLNGALSENDQSGPSASRSQQGSVSASLEINRTLLALPAGPFTVNLSGRMSQSRSDADTGGERRTFSRRVDGLNGSLSIPLSRRAQAEGEGGRLGDLSLSLFGNLTEAGSGRSEGLGGALAWSPLPQLRARWNWSTASQTLSDAQRFEPSYFGDPITVYDFQTGASVEVLPIYGGDPDLRPPRSDQTALSISAGPFTRWKLQGGVAVQRNETVDGLGALPDPTPEVEAAFPERFQRDADGRLISLDRRSINILSATTETLTSNLGFAVPMGEGAPGARAGLVRVIFNHVWQRENALRIREGLPDMDRLSGDGGGLPRHMVGVGLDASRGRWGLNVSGRWSDAYRIRRDSGRDGPDDLRVAAFGTVDLGLTLQLERDLPARSLDGPPRRGAGLQMSLKIDNLFDARPDARLADGRPAPGYGRDDRDPVGRTLSIGLKRRF